MEIKIFKISDLKKADYNPRKISEEEMEGLKNSLKIFGLVDPIIINSDKTIIGGHQRCQAWKELGHNEIDCVMLDLDKKQEKKLNVVLNSHAVSGSFDDVRLSGLLEEFKLDDDFAILRLDVLEMKDFSEYNKEINLDDLKNQEYKIVLKFNEQDYLDVLEKLNKYRDSNEFDSNELAFRNLLNV